MGRKNINKKRGKSRKKVYDRDAYAPRLNPVTAFIRASLPAGLLLGMPVAALAGPEGGVVAAGQGSIATPDASTTVVNQASQNLIVNWESFNVNTHETVNFKQPNKSAQALNRIFDQNPSQIFGSINATGKVLLINPNGVFFSPTARVNVGGLVASGLNIKDEDFMSGRHTFFNQDGSEGGMVVNQGLISAATGGSVSLIGGAVKNEGTILATAGQVNLVAGKKVTMDFDGDGLIQFTVDEEILQNVHDLDDAVSNSGTINADGGSVLLHGKAAKDVFTNVVNNSGVIGANKIQNEGGQIKLVASGAGNSLLNTGIVDASSSDNDGGNVEIHAEDTVIISESSVITTASATGKGGKVQITGDRVGLIGETSIDASGDSGGGEVLVGGDLQGNNPDVVNASKTYVGKDVSITADAVTEGDGGKVIVWADDTTHFYGDISSTGGALLGDGGFVEVSGKELLNFKGLVDLRASQGENGTLLLDPTNIEISAAVTSIENDGGPDPFTYSDVSNDGPSPSILNVTDLVTQLALSDVIVTTASTAGDAGNITLTTNLDYDGIGTSSLTLVANNNINITGGTITDGTPGGDTLNLTLNADSDASGAGDLTISQLIETNGGTINLLAEDFIISGAGIDAGSADIFLTETQVSGPLTFGDEFVQGEVDLLSTTGTITFGRATDSTGTVTTMDSTTFQDAVSIDFTGTGANIVLAATNTIDFSEGGDATGSIVTATNLTLDTTGGATVTQGTAAPDSIVASALTFIGDGTITLNSTANDVDSISASGTTTVTFVDANDLTVGSGNGVSGISAASVSLAAADDIILDTTDGDITTTGGSVTLNSNSDATGTGGIYLLAGSSINTSGGNIVLGGGADPTTDNAVGGSFSDAGITITDATLNAGAGDISIRGIGTAASSAAYGVDIGAATATSVTSTGGTITITGTGGAGTASNMGVRVNAGGGTTSITNTTGNISITGTGGNSSGDDNNGIQISNSTVSTTGGGLITFVGKAGDGNQSNHGVDLINTAQITSDGGAISITGQASDSGATANNNDGIVIQSGTVVTATNSATITLDGTASTGLGGNNGVTISCGTITCVSSEDGLIDIDGTGNGSGAANYGVYILGDNNTGTTDINVQTTGTGDIQIDAINNASAGGTNYGLYMLFGAGIYTTGGGDITIVGQAPNIASSGAYGIDLADTGTSIITGASGGDITLTGTGSNNVSSSNSNGINVNGGVLIQSNGAGNILVTGNATTGNGLSISGDISSTNTGSITLLGTTAATGATEYGIRLSSAIGSGTSTGDITITGNSGGTTGINASGTTIQTTGAGTISIDSEGSINFASSASTVSTAGGAITLDADSESNGTGDVLFGPAGSTINSGAGTITFRGNEIDITSGADTITGTGDVVFEASQATTTVGIAGGAGTLDLSTTDLAALTEGFSNVIIGRTDGTGAITANAASFKDAVTLRVAALSGTINLNGQLDTLASTTNNSLASITLSGANATSRLSADIVTAGAAVNINPLVLISGIRTIDTTNSDAAAAGSVTISAVIDGANIGGTDTLTIDAAQDPVDGTGDATVTLTSDVEGAAGGLSILGGEDLEGLTIDGGQIDVADIVITGGAIDLEGTNVDLNGGTYQTATSGAVSFDSTSTIDLAGAVSVITAGGSNATFIAPSGVIGSGANTFSVDTSAGNGAIDFQAGANVSSVTGFTANAGAGDIDLQNVTGVLGAISVTGGDGVAGGTVIDLEGTTYSAAGAITFTGDVNLAESSGLTTILTSVGAFDIVFTEEIDDASSNTALTLNASAGGNVTVIGDIGAASVIDALTVTNSNITGLADVNVNNDITVTSTTETNLNGTSYFSNDGTITFNGAVDLEGSGNVTINSDADNDATDGAIVINNNITDTGNDSGLILTSGTDITVNAITIANALDINIDADNDGSETLTFNSGAISVGSLTVDGTGANENIFFGANATITAATGDILMGATQNITGIDINGAGSNIITATAGAIDLAAVTDSAAVNELELNAGTDITLAGVTLNSGGTALLDIDLDEDADGTQTLDLNGDIIVGSLTVDGQNANDTVLIGSNVDITTSTGDLAMAATQNISAVTLDGVGSNNIFANGGAINLAAVTDTADIAQLLLRADTDITLDSIVLNNSGANLIVMEVDQIGSGAAGAEALNVTGALTGGTISISGRDTNETMTFGGLLTTASGTVSISNAATINLNGGINSGNNIDINNATLVNAAAGTTLNATGVGIEIRDNNNVGSFNITGAGTLNITTSGLNGTVALADVTDAANANLTINASAGLTAISSVNMDGGGTFTADFGMAGAVGAIGNFVGTVTAGVVDIGGDLTTGDVVNLQNTVTATAGSVTVDNVTNMDVGNVSATANITLNAANNIDLNGTSYSSNDGNITLTGSIDLDATGAVTFDSDANNDATDGTISLNGAVNDNAAGDSALIVDADTADVSLNAIGTTTRIGALTVTGNDITFAGDVESGTITATARQGADDDSITINAVTLDSNNNNMVFRSDDIIINAAANLVSTGAGITSVTFAGETAATTIGLGDIAAGTLNLTQAELNTTGATIDEIIIGVDATQTGTIQVNNTGGLALNDSGLRLRVETAPGDIDIDSNITLTSTQGFTIEGVGDTTLLSGNILTNGGAIIINDTVLVDGARILNSGNGGPINAGLIQITGSIGAEGTPTDSLTITADGTGTDGAVNIIGTVGSGTVNGAPANPLNGFTIAAASQVDVNNINTNAGSISITGTNIDLNGTTYQTATSGAITFTGPVDLHANATLTTAGGAADNITFATAASTINADNALTNNRTLTANAGAGTVTFGGAIGVAQPLADFDVTAATINLNGGTVRVDDQGGNTSLLTGALRLGSNVLIDTDGAVDNNLNIAGTINADDATANNRTLAVTAGTGTATFGGIIGGTQQLADFDVTANTINLNTTSIRVDDNNAPAATSTMTGAVRLGANLVYDTDKASGTDSSVTFTNTVNADAVGLNRTLTVTAGGGTARFQNAVGGTQALADFDATANLIRLQGNVTANAGAGGQTVTLTGPVQIENNVIINTDGTNDNNVSLTSTVNALDATTNNRSFSVTSGAGNITVSGAMGNTQPLDGGVTLTGATINTAAITTNGTIATANQPAGNVTITGSGSVTIGGAINAIGKGTGNGGAVDIDAGAANPLSVQAITANSAAGGSGGIIKLNDDGGTGTITLNGNLTSTGTITGGTTTLGTATVLATGISISTGAAPGNIVFDSTVDSDASENNTLNLTAGLGSITFSGAVGSGVNRELGTITVNSVNNVTALSTIEAARFTQTAGTGASQFVGQVDVTAAGTNFRVNTNSINLDNTVNTNGGAVDLDAVTGITLDGGNIATGGIVNAVDTTDNAGSVDMDVTGAGNIALTGLILATGAGSSASAAGDGGLVTLDTFDGDITVNIITASGGAGTGQNGGNAGEIQITAGDNITIGLLSSVGGAGTVAGSANNVTLTANSGAIVDGNAGGNNINAAALVVNARDGVGSGNQLETTLTSVNITNTNSGNVELAEQAAGGALDILAINNTAGNIDVSAAAGTLTATGAVQTTGAGDITLTAVGASSDIEVNADIITATGDIELDAGRSITTDNTGDIITSTDGSGTLALRATDAIGTTSNRIDIDVAIVAAAIDGGATTGDIFLNQIDGVQDNVEIGTTLGANPLSGISTANNNDITVVTNAAASTMNITQAVAANGSGTVTLDVNGLASDLTSTASGTIETGSGLITLTADDDVTLAGTVGAATTGAISITADSDGTIGAGETGIFSNTAVVGNAGSGAVAIAAQTNNINSNVLSGSLIDIDSVANTTFGTVLINASNTGTININVDTGNALSATLDLGGSTLNAQTINLAGGANTATLDTLIAQNTANTWTLTSGADNGTLANSAITNTASGSATFSDFHNLTGNANTDLFDFNGGTGVSGTIDGQGGTNTLDYAGLAGPISLSLTAAGGTTGVAGTGSQIGVGFDDIDSVVGSGAGDSLTGFNTTATWTLDGGGTENYLDTGSGQDLDFTNDFNTLTGGAGDDTFNITTIYTADLIGDPAGGGNDGSDSFVFDDGANPAGTAQLIGSIDGGVFDGAGGGTAVGNDSIDFSGSKLGLKVTVNIPGTDNGQQGLIEDEPLINIAPDTDLITAGFDNINALTGNGLGVLLGPNQNTWWNVTGTDTGFFGDALTNITTGFNNFSILGGNQNDVFIFQNAGEITLGIDGGLGNNILAGTQGADTFNINDTFPGGQIPTPIAGTSVNFTTAAGTTYLTNIDSIDGTDAFTATPGTDTDTGADIFNITVDWSGSLNGVGGNDSFVFTNGVTVGGSITGGTGSDTLNWAAYNTARSVLLTNSTVDGFNGNEASITGGFVTIDVLTGGTASDTLIGQNVISTWTVNGGGTQYTNTTGGFNLAFSNFENLTGSGDADTFNVTGNHTGGLVGAGGDDVFNFNSGALTGNVDGGDGNDVFDFNGGSVTGSVDGAGNSDTLNYADFGGPIAVTLSGVGGTDGFSGSATSITGTFDDIDVVVGSAGTDTLTGINATAVFTINGGGTSYVSSGRTLSFSDVENLTGGSLADTFNVTGAHTGDLDGAGGDDIFNIGAALTGGITSVSGNNDYNLNAGGSVSLNITGGTGNDIFDFNGGSVTGTVNGGTAGTNTLDYVNATGPIATVLSAIGTNVGFQGTTTSTGGFDNVTDLVGSSGTDNLTGQNAIATFTVQAGNDTYVASGRTLTFDATTVENLTGNAGADTFTISAAHTGDLDGAGGDDIFNIGAALTGGITSASGNNDYNLNAGGSVSLNITGGTGNDIFDFNGGSVTGTVNGGTAGTNTLDYVNATGPIATVLSAIGTNVGFQGTTTSTGGFDNVTDLVGSSGTDNLTGQNAIATFTVIGGGTSYVSSGRTLTFDATTVENLTGNAGADTFTISAAHTGDLDGAGGDDIFNIGAALTGGITSASGNNDYNLNAGGSVSLNITGGTGNDIFDFNGGSVTGTVNGGTAGTNTLDYAGVAGPISTTVTALGTNVGFQGTTTSTGGFNNVNALVGSVANDTLTAGNLVSSFNINSVNGGSYSVGANSMTFTSVEIPTGGANNDTFTFTNTGSVTGAINGGGGTNTLVGDDDGNAFATTGANAGTLTGKNSGWSNFQNLTGGAVVDTFNIAAGSLSGRIDGAAGADSATFSAGKTVTLNGANTGISNVETINLGGGTLVGSTNSTSDWNLTGANSGTVDDQTTNITFTGANTVRGGADTDNFTSNGTFNGTVNFTDLDNTWIYTPGARLTSGAVTGTGSVTILAAASPTISPSIEIGAGDLVLPTLTGFAGHTIIGGTLTPAGATPFYTATAVEFNTTTLTVTDPVNSGGSVTLLGGDVFLNNDITLTSGTIGLVAGGDGLVPGSTGVIDASAGPVTLTAPSGTEPSGAFIAQNDLISADNITLAFGGGEVDVATGAGEQVEFNGASVSNDIFTDPAFETFVNGILGSLNLTIVQAFSINPASALIGLETLAFIDLGLFEEELQLFGTIGTGIALALAQCEEQEGCAPNVTEDELNTLIATLEARIEELRRRLEENENNASRVQIEGLIESFNKELLAFSSYLTELQAFFSAEAALEEQLEDDFIDEEPLLDGEGEDEISVLAGVLETIKGRIDWLESLKQDPAERERLSEATGLELTLEELDKLIQAAEAEAAFIENRIRLLIEGTEARLGVQPIFTAEARDYDDTQVLHYGPGLLQLDNNKLAQTGMNVY